MLIVLLSLFNFISLADGMGFLPSVKTLFMEKKPATWQEQKAPEKNTDRAFVKVNKDGSPSTMEKPANGRREKEKTEREQRDQE